MSKARTGLHVLTANRLSDGGVVFLTGEGQWSDRLATAKPAIDDLDIAQLERAGDQAANANIVVDPYLMKVEQVASSFVPIKMRERRRVLGPSIGNELANTNNAASAFSLAS